MPVAQRGGEWSCYREWSCSTVGHSSSLWESMREMQKQPEAEAGAGREGVRAAGTQTPCCGGRDTHGAMGDPTLAVGTQQENELFAKWKKRETGKLSHKKFKLRQWEQHYFHRLFN